MGPASDVYSLGAILYHCLTGRAPFVGHTLADTLHQVLNKEPIPARLLTPSIPADLETICAKCLEKEPSRRYATAQELADELGRFLLDEPIHARPSTKSERVRRWCRRNPALSASFALGADPPPGPGHRIAYRDVADSPRPSQGGGRHLYAANINKAFQASEAYDVFTVRERLRWIDESPRQRALRGWDWRSLAERAKGDQSAILGTNSSWLSDLAVSPDGRRLATISEDGVVALWDLATQKELGRTNAHANRFEHQPDSSHHARGLHARRSHAGHGRRRWGRAPLGHKEQIPARSNRSPACPAELLVAWRSRPTGNCSRARAGNTAFISWALSEAGPTLAQDLRDARCRALWNRLLAGRTDSPCGLGAPAGGAIRRLKSKLAAGEGTVGKPDRSLRIFTGWPMAGRLRIWPPHCPALELARFNIAAGPSRAGWRSRWAC